MAKSPRVLPANFALDLPDDQPVVIGDFLDEPPPVHIARKPQQPELPPVPEPLPPPVPFRPEIVRTREEEAAERGPSTAVRQKAQQPSIIRYQLNLTPRSKMMLDDLVKHIRTFSPQNDARTSEVFQGIMTLLHNAMDELELAELRVLPASLCKPV